MIDLMLEPSVVVIRNYVNPFDQLLKQLQFYLNSNFESFNRESDEIRSNKGVANGNKK